MKQPNFKQNRQYILLNDLGLTECIILPDFSRAMPKPNLLILPHKEIVTKRITEVKP